MIILTKKIVIMSILIAISSMKISIIRIGNIKYNIKLKLKSLNLSGENYACWLSECKIQPKLKDRISNQKA